MKQIISLGWEIKMISFLICLLMAGTSVTAQIGEECLFDSTALGNPDPNPTGIYSYSTDVNLLNSFDPIVFNIFFWGINDGNGNPGVLELDEEHCLTTVAHLNRIYNEFGIFFKYHGMDIVKSETFYHLTGSEMGGVVGWANAAGHKKNDAFNIYVASGGSPGSLAPLLYYRNIVTHYNFFTKDGPMVHEMGHCLGLQHTHKSWWAGHVVPQYCGDCGGEDFCTESVTRDPADANYNASEAGDYVTDTPAIPNFRIEWCRYNGVPDADCNSHFYEWVDPVTFEYNGSGTDCLGVPYIINPEDVKNYMSYAPNPNNLTFFLNYTAGQKIRMHESIAYDPAGQLAAAQTTVEVLYEPYKGVYSSNGSTGTQTGATFQPGFDYEFVSCGPYGDYPPPLDYNDTSFWYVNGGLFNYSFVQDIPPANYDAIVHKNNFAIRIQQINNTPRNCYSASGPATLGAVIKFEDEVFNNNITVTPKDSTEINSPNLINDLVPGLYKIEKDHGGGAIEETVILKQNN